MLRRNFTAFAALILFVCFSTGAAFAAASGVVEGTVKDAQTGDALPGANVLIVGTSLGAATDLNGRFVINSVEAGSYTIKTTYVGYTTKETPVTVKSGETVILTIKLEAVGVKGKEVVVTAQASGQNGAINQQLTSDRIENVVSAARIQELPDQNAAESVGRLPGVSLIREGGQATQVVIRGLAPQYNQITIDGVQMPANVTPSNPSDLNSAYSSGDRGVNLSMISSSMLGGIEVTKSITPDMDAAVLGGVVNFNLREAQTRKLEVHLLAQGGYDNLKNTYNDYKFVATAEKRFLDDKLGIFAEADAEQQNLSANTLGANYYLNGPVFGQYNLPLLSGVVLTDVPSTQKRYDGTVTMDYRLHKGKIDLMTFYSYGTTRTQHRRETFGLPTPGGGASHVYTLMDQRSDLGEATGILDIQKQIGDWNVEAKVADAFSQNRQPFINNWDFQQTAATGFTGSDAYLNPVLIPALAHDSLLITPMFDLSSASSISRQNNLTGWINIKKDLNFSNLITSTIKFGGEFQYTNRSYNYAQGDGNVYFSGANVIQGIQHAFPWMAKTLNAYGMILPLVIDSSYSYGNFLGGNYKMGYPLNLGRLTQILGIAEKYGTLESWSPDAVQSGEHNYYGHEYKSAGYGMMTIHFGPDLTFLPGVRYQVLQTIYTAPRALSQLGPISRYTYAHRDTTMNEANGFWLPMVHLMYNPFSWLQIHLAYTNTLTYPDYTSITPELQVGTSSVDYHNYLLKPGTSANYDAVFSFYNNTVGLFSVDGFYKRIKNLIFGTGQTYIINPADYPGVPSYAAGYSIQTSVNDPYPAEVYGVELDWQTHFWYLPGPLSGLVLNVNYTHVISKAKYPYTYLNVHTINKPPYQVADTIITYYNDRLLQQPDDIANVVIGYDYGGFGARISMLYQNNVFSATEFWPSLRANTSKYLRWDASVKQNLPWSGLQIYLDLYNLNKARDTQLIQGIGFPTSENFYGLTADMGIRLAIQ